MYEDIQEEARDGFDLVERLLSVSPRTKEVTIYTDVKAGAELGGAEDVKQGDIVMGRRRWGIRGRIDEISNEAQSLQSQREYLTLDGEAQDALDARAAELEKEMKALTKRIPPLLKTLTATALVFTLRTLPDIIIRDARRKAKQNLDLKGKNIPEDRAEEYSLEYAAILLAESTSQWVDNKSGKVYHSLSIKQAHDLKDYLPAGEFDKLDRAMYKLSMESAIGKNATDDLDF